MNRSQLMLLPFVYTYLTRLKNVRGLLDYVVRDVAIPLIPAVTLFGANGRAALLLWAGFVALYEVGYVLNDRASNSGEPDGDRLHGDLPSMFFSIVLRAAVFGGVALWSFGSLGREVALTYTGLSLGIVGLLLIHTLLLSRTAVVRTFSFATLALSKYGPPLIPLIGWEHAAGLMAAVFLMYGFPRTVHYVVRKISPAWPADQIRRFQVESHGLGLFPGLVLVFPDLLTVSGHGWTAPALLWALYAVAWIAALVSYGVRHR